MKTTKLSCTLLAACLAGACTLLHTPDGNVSRDEHMATQSAVYDALLKKLSGDCPVYVDKNTGSDLGTLMHYTGASFSNMSGVDPSTLNAYTAANLVPHPLQWESQHLQVHVLDLDEPPQKPGQTGEKDQESAMPPLAQAVWAARREHACVRSVYTLSAPGLSDDGGDALVLVQRHCGGLCGGGEAYHLRRDDSGAWVVSNSQFLWTH